MFRSVPLRIRRLISLLVLGGMLFGAEKLLTYLLEPVDYPVYLNHEISKYESRGINIDMIITGNSRPLYSLDPAVFEEVLGLDEVYNASVTGQCLPVLYYQIRHLLERFTPKYLVLNVSWMYLFPTSKEYKLLGIETLTQRERLEYALENFPPSQLIYPLLTSFRHRINISEPQTIKSIIKEKRYLKETRFAYSKNGTYKGYQGVEPCRSKPFLMGSQESVQMDELDPDMIAYLDRITALCKEKGVQLLLVTMPISNQAALNTENYQDFIDYMTAYAADQQVSYLNLNLLKDREQFLPDELFFDEKHFCKDGAETISRIYAELLKDSFSGIDISSRFYTDFDEWENELDQVISVGVRHKITNNELHIGNIRSVPAHSVSPLYKLDIVDKNQNLIASRDWSSEIPDFDVNIAQAKFPLTLQISAKTEKNPEEKSWSVTIRK